MYVSISTVDAVVGATNADTHQMLSSETHSGYIPHEDSKTDGNSSQTRREKSLAETQPI